MRNETDYPEANANYMDVQVPGRTQPSSTLTTSGTGTMIIKQKRNTKSYKTELKAMTKERNRWRLTCGLMLIGYLSGLIIALVTK